MKRAWVWGISILLIGGVVVIAGLFLATLLVVSPQHGCQAMWGDGVALLDLHGPIVEVDALLEQIEEARRDDAVKAVVLRVNSPGGSVGSSQELFHALRRLDREKPLVASFGMMATSGGYYAGVAARKIFALPGTATASIGVRMSHLDAEALLQWSGLKPEILKSGYFKDVGAMHRPMREDERALLLGVLGDMHEQFRATVAERRGIPREQLDPMADGRVMTGDAARAAGLIDAIGDLQDAINAAAAYAGLDPDPRVIHFEPQRPWWMALLGGRVRAAMQGVLAQFPLPGFGYYWLP
ncbi:MAG: signal peptide peptidase SppA [Deltaproteobacteria bacterium]|nr:signal peptide peptidase SppA [Deltaproteobacteria bacterium]